MNERAAMATRASTDSGGAAAEGAAASAAAQLGSPRGEGFRAATQLVDSTEERVEQLERRM